MKKIFTIQLLIILVIALFSLTNGYTACRADAAGTPALKWVYHYGGSNDDFAMSVQQTGYSDDGYIVAGYTLSNNGDVSGKHGGADAWVVRLILMGTIAWQKCYGGSGDDFANDIRQTSDGSFIFAGYTNSNDGDVSGKHGAYDAWVVKLNTSGDIEWQKCLGGSGLDYAKSIRQTTDGGYIVAGYTNSNDGDVSGNHGGMDAWIVKLNAAGGIVWQKCFGGSGHDYAHSIQQTSDGGYIFAGYTDSKDGDVSGNHGGTDAWVVKLNASGGLVWQKCFGGTGNDFAESIQQTSDGGYIFAGHTKSNNGDVTGNIGGSDAWIVKLNASGGLVWQKCFGGSENDYAYSVRQARDDGYIFVGETYSKDGYVIGNHGEFDAWIVKLNESGKMEWQKCIGGSDNDSARAVELTITGAYYGYVVAGNAYSIIVGGSNDHHGGSDMFVFRINADPDSGGGGHGGSGGCATFGLGFGFLALIGGMVWLKK